MQGEDSGTSTPVVKEGDEDGAPMDDNEFSDLKRKKKSSKKKAADLEAFERELGEAHGEGDDGAHLDQVDDTELGDDVFSGGGAGGGRGDTESEPWKGSDRDYTYPEVCHTIPLQAPRIQYSLVPFNATHFYTVAEYELTYPFSYCIASIVCFMRRTLHYYRRQEGAIPLLPRRLCVKEIRNRFS